MIGLLWGRSKIFGTLQKINVSLRQIHCLPKGNQSLFIYERIREMDHLSHVDSEGRIKMVDTSDKPATVRNAVASARVLMSAETVAAVRNHQTPKGDPLEAARLAGILAAKRTAELIPLCHPLPITHADVKATIIDSGVLLESSVTTNAQTGVEMEALTAVSIAALTIYDMCKALDKGITISDVRLERKTGGKSGDYQRKEPAT